MKQIMDKFAKLLNVKSIISILVTIQLLFLTHKGLISGDQFLTIYTVIISFYFGVQSTKGKE